MLLPTADLVVCALSMLAVDLAIAHDWPSHAAKSVSLAARKLRTVAYPADDVMNPELEFVFRVVHYRAGRFGVGTVIAATVIGDIAYVSRYPAADTFDSYNGTAPIEVSSGRCKDLPALHARQPPAQRPYDSLCT